MRRRIAVVIAMLICVVGLSSCDVNRYDWLNHTYDAVCWNGSVVHAPLKDGGVLASTPAGQVLVYVDNFQYPGSSSGVIRSMAQGDVTGDHVAEEAVLLVCAHRPLNTPIATQDLEVFTSGPKLIAHIPLPVLPLNHTTWFPSRFQEVSIDSGHLVVTAWLYTVGDSYCCPGVHEQFTYNWDGRHFYVASIVTLDNTYYPPERLGG